MLLGNLFFIMYTLATSPSGTYTGTQILSDNRLDVTFTFQQYRTVDIFVSDVMQCNNENFDMIENKIMLYTHNNCIHNDNHITMSNITYDRFNDKLSVWINYGPEYLSANLNLYSSNTL